MTKIAAQEHASFNDVDAFCAATQGFDIEFHQLDRGKLDAELSYMASPNSCVNYVRLNRRFHQRGCGPADMLSFGLPDYSYLRNWRGAAPREPALLNFSTASGYDSVSERGFSAYTFAISESLLQREFEAIGSSLQATSIRESEDWGLTGAGIERVLRNIGHELVFDEQVSLGKVSRLKALESSLAHSIATVVSSSEVINHRASVAQRSRAIRKALELIFSSSEQLSIGTLYAQTGVCWRTLDRAFKDRFGIGPKQYIVAVRLASARRALLAVDSDRTVTEIASQSGFSHMGRFSADYRRMFGELPSQSLRR